MQNVNVAVLNGWFGICFGGAVVSAAAAAVLHPGRPALPWILAGLVLYVAVRAVLSTAAFGCLVGALVQG